jgi:maleylpyruvate isomerase
VCNLCLLCSRHHFFIHHDGWTLHIDPDGHPTFTPPRWIDAQQKPLLSRTRHHQRIPPPRVIRRSGGRLTTMENDLGSNPLTSVDLCRAAHQRLLTTVRDLTDAQARSASRLPDWTVGHVVTHLARNADGHARRLEGALRGEDVPRYPGGHAQRDRDIEEGADRPAAELVADLTAAQGRLEDAWVRSAAAGWPHAEFRAHDGYAVTESPVRRLREVEMHHVDLGMGYESSNWPQAYVEWELPEILATVPERLPASDDVRRLVAWLAGRGSVPVAIDLEPW